MDAARELLRAAERQNGEPDARRRAAHLRADQARGRAGVHRARRLRATSSSSRTAPQTAVGHDMGSGPIAPDEPIVPRPLPARPRVGLLRRHDARRSSSATPSDELRRVPQALQGGARPLGRGGPARRRRAASCYKIVCDVFEEHGYPTLLSKQPGEVLQDGFYHSLGHGVGLEVHEEPIARPRAGRARRRRRGRGRAGPLPPRLRRLPARGSRARDRGRRRGADGLPVRPRRLESDARDRDDARWRSGGTRRRRSSPRRRTRSRTSTSATSTSSGRPRRASASPGSSPSRSSTSGSRRTRSGTSAAS